MPVRYDLHELGGVQCDVQVALHPRFGQLGKMPLIVVREMRQEESSHAGRLCEEQFQEALAYRRFPAAAVLRHHSCSTASCNRTSGHKLNDPKTYKD